MGESKNKLLLRKCISMIIDRLAITGKLSRVSETILLKLIVNL